MYKSTILYTIQVNTLRPITFTVTKLEGFVKCEECTVTSEDANVIRKLVVMDTKNRPLTLIVITELLGGSALKVCVCVCMCVCVHVCVCVCMCVCVC